MSVSSEDPRGPAAAIRVVVAALARVNEAIARIALALATAMIAFTAVALVLGALERQWEALRLPLVNDLPPMMMPWIVCLLMGPMLRRGGHITVDVLDSQLTGHPRARRAVDAAVNAIILLIGMAFLEGGVEGLRFFADLGETTDTDVQFPIWWIYLSFPVGFALVALASAEGLLRAIAGVAPPARPQGGGH